MPRTDIRIFVSSPSDCEPQRTIIKEVLEDLNSETAQDLGYYLNLLDWKDLAPGLGANVQEWIDHQLGTYDILLGLMWLRFGTPIPGGAGSGTEHEVEGAVELWKRVGKPRVMFYFNDQSPPDLSYINAKQFLKVREFRESLEGLVGTFTNDRDFERRLRRHLIGVMKTFSSPPPPRPRVGPVPYAVFEEDFSDVVSARRLGTEGSLLHVVSGNLASVREMVPILPINQDFDLRQRGPRSVLASFESIRVGQSSFYEALEDQWPLSERPQAAGLGKSVYLELPSNSQDLPGVVFAVSTKDLSEEEEEEDYGLYLNTPLQGIDVILGNVLDLAEEKELRALAIPLLGSGYATIRLSSSKQVRTLIKRAALAITITKVEAALRQTTALERVVIVVYSTERSEQKDLWKTAVKSSGTPPHQKNAHISSLLQRIDALTATTQRPLQTTGRVDLDR